MRGVPAPDDRDALLETLERHVVNVWFPASIDREHGGFLSGFDRLWRPQGEQQKLLEFQARQTFIATRLAEMFPGNSALSQAVELGARFLNETMWDNAHGGWYHLTARDGGPIRPNYKHLHGMTYAVMANVAIHAATGSESAKRRVEEAIDWMVSHAYDEEHGGFMAVLSGDGTALSAPDPNVWAADLDHCNHPIGWKDMNVHGDLLDMFTTVQAHLPSEVTRKHLNEVVGRIAGLVAEHNGGLPFFYRSDWARAATYIRYASEMQNAGRLFDAMPHLNIPKVAEEAAVALIRHALAHGWDSERKFLRYGGTAGGEVIDTRFDVEETEVQWWAQLEVLKTLAQAGDQFPGESMLAEREVEIWNSIMSDLVDTKYSGFYRSPPPHRPADAAVQDQSEIRRAQQKGTEWKDASHEGRALLFLIARADRKSD